MKKKIAVLTMGLVLIAGMAGCSGAARNNSADPADAAVSSEKADAVITEAEAKEIALKHAGVTESDVTFVKCKLETDDFKQIYEVEFYSGNTEYDYDIDAESGAIISSDSDIENHEISSAGQDNGNDIGEAKAKELVLAKVEGASEADLRIRQEYDDGILIYQGTVIYNEMEYDFEIKASDGSFIEWSSESVYDD